MRLWNQFVTVVETAPGNVAVIARDRQISYVELREHVEALARHLRRNGVRPGVVVLAYFGNDPSFLVTLLACDSLGAVFVPIDPCLTRDEVHRVVRGFDGHFHLVASADLIGRFAPGASSALSMSGCTVAQDGLTAAVAPIEDLRDTIMIQFTSGSTGDPKGIMIGDAAMLYRARRVANALGLHELDKTLCSVPLTHSHGIDCLALPSLLTGGSLYLVPSEGAAPSTVLPILEKFRISFFSSVPGFYQLATKALRENAYDLTSLRLPFCGSAALTQKTAEEFLEKFGVAICQGYGLAEIAVIAVNLTAGVTGNFGSIGVPIAGIRHRIATDGELVVTSEALAHGYFRRPDLWHDAVIDGELHTGDIVSADAGGYMHIVGRKTDIINVGGQKVYPQEIEKALIELPWVEEVAVRGSEDPIAGQRVVAHVVLLGSRDGRAQAQDDAVNAMQKHLRERVSRFKLPARYVFHSDLPKSPLGKVMPEQLDGER